MKLVTLLRFALVALLLTISTAVVSAQSFDEILSKAHEGDAQSQLVVAKAYFKGENVAHDLVVAHEWLNKSASQGNAEAQYLLGYCYEDGVGVAKDPEVAVEWYRKASDAGYDEAQCALAICYETGLGVEENQAEANRLYLLAAEQGNLVAQYNLGYNYSYGVGFAKDMTQAIKWYTMAAEQGDEDAQAEVAKYYYQTQGSDSPEVKRYFGAAARKGVAWAQTMVGDMYFYGEGVEPSYHKAVSWYSKAASQGDVEGIANYGLCLYMGYGVQQNPYMGMQLLVAAAEEGSAMAQFNVGFAYLDDGDPVEALKWFRLSAKQNYPEAQAYIGFCYYYGQGVTLNYYEAVKWFKLAADQGNLLGKGCLGVCYYFGTGVTRSTEKGLKLMRESARGGCVEAQDALRSLGCSW